MEGPTRTVSEIYVELLTMNYWADNGKFNNMCKDVGNKFETIHRLVAKGRYLEKQLDYPIRESQSLIWAYTGDKPEKPRKYRPHIQKILDEVLGYVNEEAVIESVYQSMKESCQAGNLIYIYTEDTGEADKARVRTLTKIAWDKLISED